MKALFDRYLNQPIGLNYHTAYHIDEATLTLAADGYFAAVGARCRPFTRWKRGCCCDRAPGGRAWGRAATGAQMR